MRTEAKGNNQKAIRLIESWIKEDAKNPKEVMETWGKLKKRLTEQGFINLARLLESGNFKKHD